MAHYLVTGGAGFIGSHLCRHLLGQGHAVSVLDDLSSGRREALAPGASLHVGTILDAELVARLVDAADGVFHLAAIVSVQQCNERLVESHRVNVTGALQVFQAAARGGKPVVYASSAAVYGDQAGQACTETMMPRPLSPYGADKRGCELHAGGLAEIAGLASVGLRFFNVYGPGQDPSSPYAGVISRFLANRAAGAAHVVYGDGGQSRDFVFVGDVVRGLAAAMAVAEREPGAAVCNIATGQEVTLLQLIDAIDRLTGPPASEVRHEAARPGDIRHSRGDCTRMATLLGLRAETPLDRGLAATMGLDRAQTSAGGVSGR